MRLVGFVLQHLGVWRADYKLTTVCFSYLLSEWVTEPGWGVGDLLDEGNIGRWLRTKVSRSADDAL